MTQQTKSEIQEDFTLCENKSTLCNGQSPKPSAAIVRLKAQRDELIEALQNLLAVASVRIDDPRIVQFDAARAAVAKATGETK